MKILFLAWSDPETASSRTRVYQYLPYLRAAGVGYKVLVYNSPLYRPVTPSGFFRKSRFVSRAISKVARAGNVLWKWRTTRGMLRLAAQYDVVFVQKVILPSSIQERLARANPRIVFDMDDAIYADSAEYDVEGLLRQLKIIRLAVIENTSTQEFFGSRGVKTLRITGPIDCTRYRPAPPYRDRKLKDRLVLGWIGSGSTVKYLKLVEAVLTRVLRRFEQVEFVVIGAEYSLDHPRVRCVPWTLTGEVEALDAFDIGIMPLTDDPWTRGKGGYKLLQYMAMGIPSVVSPVGVNAEILIDGQTGLLASGDENWERALTMLIVDEPLRLAMGARARERAEKVYSYEVYAPALLHALDELDRGPAARAE